MLCLKFKSTDQSTLQNVKCKHKKGEKGSPENYLKYFIVTLEKIPASVPSKQFQ